MSSTQFLIDAATRHQVFLQRYGDNDAKKARKILNRLRRAINARLSQEPALFQRQRIDVLLSDLEKLMTIGYSDIAVASRRSALDLAVDEAQFSVDLFNRASTPSASFNPPAETALLNAVEDAPMRTSAVGPVISGALAAFGVRKTAQVLQIVSDGVVLGDTTQEVSRKVDSNMSVLQPRQLTALVKTITNHSSAVAREETYRQNIKLINGYKFVAVLDSRTTLICASKDGKRFQTGQGPMPPLHWGCRSTTIPIIKSQFAAGASLTGKRKTVVNGKVEQVTANTTYGGWLKKQPIGFVDEALGVERSKLFRSGKLKIGKFVDPTGRVYTLEQLRQMNPFVFLE